MRRSSAAVGRTRIGRMRSGIGAAILTMVLTSCAAGEVSVPAATEAATFTATAPPSVAATPTPSIPSPEPATEPASATPLPSEAADSGLELFASAVNGLRLRGGEGPAHVAGPSLMPPGRLCASSGRRCRPSCGPRWASTSDQGSRRPPIASVIGAPTTPVESARCRARVAGGGLQVPAWPARSSPSVSTLRRVGGDWLTDRS